MPRCLNKLFKREICCSEIECEKENYEELKDVDHKDNDEMIKGDGDNTLVIRKSIIMPKKTKEGSWLCNNM